VGHTTRMIVQEYGVGRRSTSTVRAYS
jgi:hypothetical protein